MKAFVLLLIVLLAGCNRGLVKIDPPPKIVRVTVEVPVSLCPDGGSDCALLRDCYNEPAKEQTYAESKRLANLRNDSIETDCNKRWAKVRALQPAAKP